MATSGWTAVGPADSLVGEPLGEAGAGLHQLASAGSASHYQVSGYRPLSAGAVLSRTFAMIGEHPLLVIGTVFLVGGLPATILHYLLGTFDLTPASATSTAGRIGAIFAVSVIDQTFNLVTVAALVRATVAAQSRQNADFVNTISTALARPGSLLLVALLYTLGTLGGLMAFIIPGIILVLTWSVVLPVFVEERSGIVASFRRSRELTSGFRGSIFGIQFIVGILTTLTALVLHFLTYSLFGVPTFGQTYSIDFGVGVLNLISSTLTLTISAVVPGILYVELTERQAGAPDDALSAIFE